jgi:hypothetical protein
MTTYTAPAAPQAPQALRLIDWLFRKNILSAPLFFRPPLIEAFKRPFSRLFKGL